jgi:hypothetical protein
MTILRRALVASSIAVTALGAIAAPAFAVPSPIYTPGAPGPVAVGGTITVDVTPTPGCTTYYAALAEDLIFTFTSPNGSSTQQLYIGAGTTLPVDMTIPAGTEGWTASTPEIQINAGENCPATGGSEGKVGVKAAQWDIAAEAVTPVMPASIAAGASVLGIGGFLIARKRRSVSPIAA